MSCLEEYLAMLFNILGLNDYMAMFGKNEKTQRTWFFKTAEEIVNHVSRFKDDYNLYVSLSTIKGQKDRKTESQYKRKVIALDFDGMCLTEVLSRFSELKLKYSMIVSTGHGYHVYVRIKETTDIGTVTRVTKELSRRCGGDIKVALPTQVMRLPESFNLKEINKIPVKIVVSKQSKEYDIEELDKRFKSKIQIAENTKEVRRVVLPKEDGYKCIERIEKEGAKKGNRNFLLGVLIEYYRDVLKESRESVEYRCKQFNRNCYPPKDKQELKSEIEGFYKDRYCLLNCSCGDEKRDKEMRKYCVEGCTGMAWDDNKLTYITTNQNIIKKITGFQIALLLILSLEDEYLSSKEISRRTLLNKIKIEEEITDLLNIDLKTVTDSSAGLVAYKDGKYRLEELEAKDKLRIGTDVINAVLDGRITPGQLRTFVLLKIRVHNKQDCTMETLAALLKTSSARIKFNIDALEEEGLLQIEKRRSNLNVMREFNTYHSIK